MTAQTPKQIARADLPKMYRDASDSSARSQKLFFRWNLINFGVLVLAAAISAFKDASPQAPLVSAVLFAAGAVMTFWLRKSRLERHWYRSRAVAESVKTLSWRFMTCASPFEHSLTEEEATRRLERVLHDIATQEREIPAPELREVTPKMKTVREWTASQRGALYLQERVEDQYQWYTREARKDSKQGRQLMYAAVVTQVVALALALVMVAKHIPDLVGVFAAVSASALAWLTLKRYEDLAEAYETAAKELSRIGSEAPTNATDESLSQFVIDSENAISREHTLWLAKRS
jgi:Flp pilus assembly protein TadB